MRGAIRCFLILAGAALALCLLVLCAFALEAGNWLAAPSSPPVQADAIVVLGGDDDGERAIRALALYQAGYAPNLVLTGLEIGRYAAPASSNWRVSMLVASGVPANAITLERHAKNTYQEARNILALMKVSGWKRVLVVSDPPHMRRLSWTWGAIFHGPSEQFTLVASDPDWWSADNWWRQERAGVFVITEYIKLAYYAVNYRLLRRRVCQRADLSCAPS